MDRGVDEQRKHIIQKLELLNGQIRRQMSVWHVFRNGLIQGVAFVVGSTVLTAIVVSIVLRFFGDTVLADVILWLARER